MTAKQYFEENLSGEPLTQEAVEEALQDFARKYLCPDKVNRVEVINHSSVDENHSIGRIFTHYNVKSCELVFQDGMKTLKIFI